MLIKGTHEPLTIYGLNVEATKHADYACATNCEIANASNVRIYSVKREGVSPSFIIRDSRNVAIYSSGAMRGPVRKGLGGYVQIYGRCGGILLANFNIQRAAEPPNGEPTLREALSGCKPVEIPWPDNVSLYKRGEIDDTPFRSVSPAGGRS